MLVKVEEMDDVQAFMHVYAMIALTLIMILPFINPSTCYLGW